MSITSHPLSAARRTSAVTKFAATTAAATLAFGLTAAPAAAEGIGGEYVGNAEGGHNVNIGGEKIGTNLFKLKLEDGTVLKTYCIDFETDIRGGAAYEEDAWENYPGKGDFAEPAKVHWVLQNSFPTVDVAALAEQSGAEGLDQRDAVAGTQAAIWHFSNDVDLGGQNDAEVTKLYDYLVENAEEEPQTTEPDISLSISPASAEGKAGETIGKFTLETSAESVPVKLSGPEGTKLVNPDNGEEITGELANGAQFGVAVPEDAAPGKAGVSASISTELHMGRLFKGLDGEEATQTLITAESGEVSADAGVQISWAEATKPSPSPSPSETPETPEESPSPSPSETPDTKPTPSESPSAPAASDEDDEGLPVTGAALGGLVAAAVAALAAGGAVMYLSRKRRSSSSVS